MTVRGGSPPHCREKYLNTVSGRKTWGWHQSAADSESRRPPAAKERPHRLPW